MDGPWEAVGREGLRAEAGSREPASVRIEAEDLAALERLLRYVLRPALSVKRMVYRPELERVRYYLKKGWPLPGEDGEQMTLEWTPAEFLAKFARLIPPARIHLVRYFGALAPRSPLRRAVTRAARERADFPALCEGLAVCGVVGVAAGVVRAARKAAGAAAKSWAACLKRVFEINPISCLSCGSRMTAISVIVDDGELSRLLAHLRLPADFPRTRPSRGPPVGWMSEDSQVEASLDDLDGKEQAPSDD